MNRKLCSVPALILAAVFCLGSLAGCSRTINEADYAKTVVATYGNEKIYLDEANFMLRREQYLMESFYLAYFGGTADFWQMDVGTGTLAESTRKTVMSEIYQTRVLVSKAAEYGVALTAEDEARVNEAIADFREGKDEALLAQLGATDELITKVYHDNALAYRVWEYLTKDIDTTVDEESYHQVRIHYLLYNKPAEEATSESASSDAASASAESTPALTPAEQAALEDKAEEIIEALKGGTSWADEVKALQDEGLTASQRTETFGKNQYTNAYSTAAWSMKTGEYTTAYVEGEGYYVLYCESDNDEEAKHQLIDQELANRRGTMFTEKYTAILAECPEFKVNESVWAQIRLDKTIYVIPTEPETQPASESASETPSAAQ